MSERDRLAALLTECLHRKDWNPHNWADWLTSHGVTLAVPAPAVPDVPYGPCPICGEPRPAHVPRQHVHTIIGAFVAGRSGEEELNRRIQEVIEAQVAWALRDALNAVAARGAPAEGAADCPMCGAPESYGHLCPERRG